MILVSKEYLEKYLEEKYPNKDVFDFDLAREKLHITEFLDWCEKQQEGKQTLC